METREYLIEDIKRLPEEDVHKLYKYVRRYLVANIQGLKDPLETTSNSDYAKCSSEIIEQLQPDECDVECVVVSILKKHFA